MTLCMRFAWLPCALLCASAPIFAHADLTGSEVVNRCRKAYDALTSYKVVTDAHIVSSSKHGGTQDVHSTTWFQRPGKFRVEATSGGYPFAFRSNGIETWSAMDGKTWRMDPMESLDGASNGTSVLLLLRHSRLDPFNGITQFADRVTLETVGGRAAYKVDVKLLVDQRAWWIDAKTFRLLKTHAHVVVRDGVTDEPSQTDEVLLFSHEEVNPKIRPGTFAKPRHVGPALPIPGPPQGPPPAPPPNAAGTSPGCTRLRTDPDRTLRAA